MPPPSRLTRKRGARRMVGRVASGRSIRRSPKGRRGIAAARLGRPVACEPAPGEAHGLDAPVAAAGKGARAGAKGGRKRDVFLFGGAGQSEHLQALSLHLEALPTCQNRSDRPRSRKDAMPIPPLANATFAACGPILLGLWRAGKEEEPATACRAPSQCSKKGGLTAQTLDSVNERQSQNVHSCT
jgi:hypothetical protein